MDGVAEKDSNCDLVKCVIECFGNIIKNGNEALSEFLYFFGFRSSVNT